MNSKDQIITVLEEQANELKKQIDIYKKKKFEDREYYQREMRRRNNQPPLEISLGETPSDLDGVSLGSLKRISNFLTQKCEEEETVRRLMNENHRKALEHEEQMEKRKETVEKWKNIITGFQFHPMQTFGEIEKKIDNMDSSTGGFGGSNGSTIFKSPEKRQKKARVKYGKLNRLKRKRPLNRYKKKNNSVDSFWSFEKQVKPSPLVQAPMANRMMQRKMKDKFGSLSFGDDTESPSPNNENKKRSVISVDSNSPRTPFPLANSRVRRSILGKSDLLKDTTNQRNRFNF